MQRITMVLMEMLIYQKLHTFCSFEALLFIFYTSNQKLILDLKLLLFKTLSTP